MTTPQPLPLVSVKDYLAAEERAEIRHEYIGGFIYAMVVAETSHNRVKGNVFAALHKRLEASLASRSTRT